VILQRSVEDAPPAAAPAKAAESKATASDEERKAISFLSYDLDVHLQPRENAMAVRAQMELRNDGAAPLSRLPLQISSTLEWTSARIGGKAAKFTQRLLDSDIDHTGAVREAVIELAEPLASQQTLTVDLTYEGTVAQSTSRLEKIGTPVEMAQASDWDRISEDFVGLRGFGNVAWYPVAAVPVALGDGARFFNEIAAQRQRHSQAMVTMKVTEEFFGEPPNLAVLDGQTFAVSPASMPDAATVPGIVTCSLPRTTLGFTSLSLFLVARTKREDGAVAVYARPDDVESIQAYFSAAAMVAPLLRSWLGKQPKGVLTIVDLPEAGDDAFENGTVLFANVHSTEPDKLTGMMVHSLTHAYFQSPYPWLQEGVASFMASLWVEKNSGRDAAIQQLDNSRGALSLGDTGESALLDAREPVYYRTKATYVFWMLRDVAGEEALAKALSSYQPGSDVSGTGFQQVLERASGKQLTWFFDNWVNHDKGLPDFSIAGVYPTKTGAPNGYLVAVDVANSGTAEAEVPVSVTSGTTTVTERLRVPAKSQISHRFVVQGPPGEVAVNDGTVPEIEASVHKQTLSAP
jgi:aminopeptidase N